MKPRTVDRSFAKMIAYKRLVTGTLAISAGIGLIVFAVTRQLPMATPFYGALVLFFGGGAWALTDGLRLRRELMR
jgi:hypothetical protein